MGKLQDTTELSSQNSADAPHEESPSVSPSSIIREEEIGWGTNKRMSEVVTAKVVKYATKKFDTLMESPDFQTFQESSDADSHQQHQQQLCQITHSQIQIGRLLGEGAFSSVFEIKWSANSNQIDATKCVVKVLRQKLLATPNLFAACALGIAREGAILAATSHPHILGIQATSQGGLLSYNSGRHDSFFLVLDRLDEMLCDRTLTWQKRASQLKFCLRHRKRKQAAFFLERLLAGAELADAVAHLHKHNLLHRDLKPANIGFDSCGILKVFDFDVSRVLPETSDPNQTFLLTQKIGTRRYMSPECGLGNEYNLKSDVYSFGLILYNILSTHIPFEGINDRDEHAKRVFQHGLRPHPHASWPIGITKLLEQSWDSDSCQRPTMEEIHGLLRRQVADLGLEQQQQQQTATSTSAIRIRRQIVVSSSSSSSSSSSKWSTTTATRNSMTPPALVPALLSQ